MSENAKKIHNQQDFSSIVLSIASPEDVVSWSHGEVTKPETINYRTQKPEADGLFCERIFGPVKNWECACGKYKRIRYRGIVCEKCGVEVIHSKVRRERMGHIKLAVPVTHPWFLRSTPSKLGLLLDLPVKKLELVVYFAAYIVVEIDERAKEDELQALESEYKKLLEKVKSENSQSLAAAKGAVKSGAMTEKDLTALEAECVQKLEEISENFQNSVDQLKEIEVGKILSELDYRDVSMKFGHVFRAGIGADAIREIVQGLDLKKLQAELEVEVRKTSGQKQKKSIKRVKLIDSFIRNNMKPEWMILTAIPVISPDLRPMVQLDGGRFATSDLNDLYRRVINRNGRLKKLIQLGAPEIICRNEKRMLQESVDILISNSSRSTRAGMNYAQKRKLKSLSDMLKGKQGRFRQNLLGKRVDYSGRSVIVVGPDLRLDECGLPKKVMMELFKPFVIAQLIKFELAYNVRSAEKLVKEGDRIVWDILDEVIQDKYVLLNRAPTLHRLGIQAFRPKLVAGKAIHLHPLVCAAYNADFDGDQMAVHLPLSLKAQAEAKHLMTARRNILKPSSGEPIIEPSQDMVLGCYFLTQSIEGKQGTGRGFVSADEAVQAYESELVHLQAPVKVRIEGEVIETTVGRIFFNRIIPEGMPFQNKSFGKKELANLLAEVFAEKDEDITAKLADDIKDLGFKYATKSGITISAFDFHEAPNRDKIIDDANEIVNKITKQYRQGLITDEERYTTTIKLWSRVKTDITNEMVAEFENENDVFYQINSGARGNWGQVTQIAGMKGLVVNPAGKTIELPVRTNLKRGFSILEYFNATHAGRKGKSDTALKTAEAGYLTRRLVDSVQDIVVKEADSNPTGFRVITQAESTEMGIDFGSRIFGRFTAQDIKKGSKTIVKKDTLIDEEVLNEIKQADIEEVAVHSVFFSNTESGVCQKTYGMDLGNKKLVKMGTPVGIIAAQSIGEPGTQLTMRSFHMGGVATEGDSMSQGLTRVEELFEARSPKNPAVMAEISGTVSIKKGRTESVITLSADKAEEHEYHLGYNMEASVKKGDAIKEKQIIARSTESKAKIKALNSGKVLRVEADKIVVKESVPAKRTYTVPNRKVLKVKDGQFVEVGTPLVAGHVDLRELMELTSVAKVQEYILKGVLQIYASQGQDVNERHIEVIVRQMTSKVRIVDAGDSDWLSGETKDIVRVRKANEKLIAEGKKPVLFEQLLLGLTRISLWTDSWLSAASFQETIRVLVNASSEKRPDSLEGLKENVIIGRLIPAGTGYEESNDYEYVFEDLPEPELEEEVEENLTSE
ncbi:DNA-directed RNA polymerase subunit beta' [bacterium DOLZORAL124_38_8]|nr:MAG: DNA-directed RNA polymerase subunit beta' [bacterium DOLZORAL124_38_8]